MYLNDPDLGDSGFGQLTLPRFTVPTRPRPSLLQPGPQLQMPPYETIVGFGRDISSLSAVQRERVNRVAQFIASTWPGNAAISSVRLTGYINNEEWQAGLGERRAIAVRDALLSALNQTRPGLATQLRWITEDRGMGSEAKVNIYLWAGPTPPPVPPLLRLPSPAEAARQMVPPQGPDTPEQRIQRILRTLPPAPPARRSFTQMFWQRVDEQLNITMSRLDVPRSLRGYIRDGAHAAIRRGSEALLNQIVGATGLPSEVQDAIRNSARALLEVPIR